MQYSNLSIKLLSLFLFLFGHLDGQVLLQLEIAKEVNAVKFAPGDVLVFKSLENPDEWQKKKIERIILDENILILEDGMLLVKDITHVRLSNGAAAGLGKLFTGFGAGWFLFGGIAHFTSNYNFSWGTFAIGAVAIGVGWLFNKVVSKRTFRMGKNGNLRIIDISFPEPVNSSNAKSIP